MIFVNPYEDDLALIGTTDIPVEGRPEDVAIEAAEIDYLLGVLNRYFREPPSAGRHRPQLLRRPPALRRRCRPTRRRSPATTCSRSSRSGPEATGRRCSRCSAARSRPTASSPSTRSTSWRRSSPQLGPAWTAARAAAGRRHAGRRFRRAGSRLSGQPQPWLPAALARHYGRLYGTRADALLGRRQPPRPIWAGISAASSTSARPASCRARNGRETAEDILKRRTKHGLHLGRAQVDAFNDWLSTRARACQVQAYADR